MSLLPPAVTSLAARLTDLTWVSDLLVAGSLATGDYVLGRAVAGLIGWRDARATTRDAGRAH
jgi:hypothetical protein